MMRNLFALVLFCVLSTPIFAKDFVYKGPWKTTNELTPPRIPRPACDLIPQPRNGIAVCIVKSTGDQKWEARFYGVWQGVKYDYTVKFTGKFGEVDDLKGTAFIDGAYYKWTGTINEEKFEGKFTGNRYIGSFNMSRN